MIRTNFRFKARTKKVWIPRLLGLLIVLVAVFASEQQTGRFAQMGNLLFDQYQKLEPRTYHNDIPVRVIDIDNETIARIGQWPWSRLTMARFNDRLARAGAAVIAYDIVFSETDRTSPQSISRILAENPSGSFDPTLLSGLTDHDEIFAQSLANSPSVLAFFLLSEPSDAEPAFRHSYGWGGTDPTESLRNYFGTLPAIPALSSVTSGEGFVSFNPEFDGIVRAAPLFQRVDQRIYPSLSMEALRVAQGAQSYVLKATDGNEQITTTLAMAEARVGDFTLKTDFSGRYRVYFAEPSAENMTQRTIPAWKILDESVPVNEWSDGVMGNIVFIGPSADGLKDLVATPMTAAYGGVNVHAEIVEQIIGEALHGHQILARPAWANVLERLLILIPGLLMIWLQPRLGAGLGAGLSLTLIIAIGAYSWMQFSNELVLINPLFAILSIGLTYLVMTIVSYWLTERERSQIRGAFSRYLSPEMVSKVSEDPSLLTLGGQERPMTILFLDVRSFSKISESMQPQEIVTFLNLFLTPMTDVLQNSGATIDKYIGDAIVAFWNAPLDDPNHEKQACKAVLAMGDALRDLNKKYKNQTEIKWPENLSMGIGLNTGICCVGNLGSEQRFSYSMIGDAANLASRIEGLTKQYRVEALVGESTASAASDYGLLEADMIQVVGRVTPERVFILAAGRARAKRKNFRTLKKEHTRFMEDYRAQDWDAATTRLETLKSLAERFSLRGYYEMMAERILDYRQSPPPPDWDGVFVATSK